MITLAKAAKTSMRRIVRRDKGKPVVAEAPQDVEPQNMFSRFKRPASKAPKHNTRLVPDAATTSLSSTSTSAPAFRKPRKAMRTAVNKIKQHVSETLERLKMSMRGAQHNLSAAVAKTVQLEQQAEQLSQFVESSTSAAEAAREQASAAASAVGVLEHLEQQLLEQVKQLQGPTQSSPEARDFEHSLKLQHEAVLEQKAQVMKWYSNAAEAQAVHERAAVMVGVAQDAYVDAQRDMAAAAAALYEAQRATLAARQMILQAVTRAHLDDVREESGVHLDEEQLVVAERGNDVVVVGHVTLAEKLRMEQGDVWQELPAELLDVYNHTAVLAQREDYEAATQAVAEATCSRELVAQLAEEVAALASVSSAAMLTSPHIQQQRLSVSLKKEECENKVRYLSTRLNWVRMAAAQGATDDQPWVANMKLPEMEVENDPTVVAALEQLHITKADLIAVERKLAQLDCTARLQSLHSELTGRSVLDATSVTDLATKLMKGAVLREIRAFRDAKHAQHALQEACEAVQKGVREVNGQVTPESSLSRLGLEPKRLQYFMQYYMDSLSQKLSTRPRSTTPASTHPRTPPAPATPLPPSSVSLPQSDALALAPSPLSQATCLIGSPSSESTPSNGVPSLSGKIPSNGSPPSNGCTSSTGLAHSNGSTPSGSGSPGRQVPDPGPDIARVRAALQGFLGEVEIDGQATHSSFHRPGRLGSSRSTPHCLAGTWLEVENATLPGAGSSLEAIMELDSALLESVRTRLALAQLLERGDNKVVRELVTSQLAADSRVGLGLAAAMDKEVQPEGATNEAIDRLRHWYALQYMLERAQTNPVTFKRSNTSPLLPATPSPGKSNGVMSSFALSNLSDEESGSETASEQEFGINSIEQPDELVVTAEGVEQVDTVGMDIGEVVVEDVAAIAAAVKGAGAPAPVWDVYAVAQTVAAWAAVEKLAKDSAVDLVAPGATRVAAVPVAEVVAVPCTPVAEAVIKAPKPTTSPADVLRPLDLAQAFTSALMSETLGKDVGRQMDRMFSTPVTLPTSAAATLPRAATVPPTTPAPDNPSLPTTTSGIATPVPASASPSVVPAKKSQRASAFRWPALTASIFSKLSFKPPTWTEVNRMMQEKGELTGTMLALTVASWGGIVAQNMDSATLVSTLYVAAGVAALSAVNTQSKLVTAQEVAITAAERERLAAEQAAAELAAATAAQAAKASVTAAATEPAAAPVLAPMVSPVSQVQESFNLAVSPDSSSTVQTSARSATSSTAELAAPSPTAASAVSASSSSFVSAVSNLTQPTSPAATVSAGLSIESETGKEGKSTWWQRTKVWLVRMNARRPELTASVAALTLGISGCFGACVRH